MPGVVRKGVDKHIGHASPTSNPFHQTPYSNAAQSKVFADGSLVVLQVVAHLAVMVYLENRVKFSLKVRVFIVLVMEQVVMVLGVEMRQPLGQVKL